MANLHNRYKSAERKISQKNLEYLLNYKCTPCHVAVVKKSSFWLILKQQWTIEEISIFSNSSHFEWRAGLLDTILKGDHPSQICFNLVLRFQRRFKCDLKIWLICIIGINRLKEKFPKKNLEYLLNYSLPCSSS
jgi:hypothetical protein